MPYLLDESRRQLVCPKCRVPTDLWRGVYVHADASDGLPEDNECWHDIETILLRADQTLEITYARKSPESMERSDFTFRDWEYTDEYGCVDCGYIGDRSCLRSWAPIRHGWDGRALRAPLAGQLELETI